MGGDTDTNCCILGALIGASDGYENILTQEKRNKVLQCKADRQEMFRPLSEFEKIVENI